MQFENPHLLWFLLLLVPALIAFFWWAGRVKRQLMAQFVAARLMSNLTVGLSTGRQKARIALIVAAVAFVVLSLARPQIGFSWEEARSRGLDIVVAIDTSKSMLATDVAPNRLRRAQLAALDLKRLARTDRLALVAFAGSAFLQCPLTLDDEAFRQSVESLDVNIIPQGGSALSEAIAAAKSAFKAEDDNHKVLVLFTDGEDNEGTALEAAKKSGKDRMRIFTIGVGTANGELLRITDTQGRTEFIKDSEGNAVKSRLNESLLRDMSQETGGFYMLLSGANTVNMLYERGLAPLPKSDLASQRVKRPHERYQWLLGIAIVILLIEMLLPDRTKVKTNASAPASELSKAIVILLMALVPAFAKAGPGRALKEYQKGAYEKALTEYERSLKSRPDDARLHFNAGAAAFQNKDYDQALSHLNSSLITQDLAIQQRAYYNLGNTQFRQGEDEKDPQKKQQNWEQSIKSYDSALKLDTKDADAEFNRDLVKRRLEELKQQQQQQNQDDKQDKDDKQDQSKQDQQKKDQQSKDQKSKDQQKQDEQQQQQKSEEQKQQEQQKQDQASQQDKQQGEEKKGQEASQKPDKGEQQEDGEAQPQGAKAVRMTPQQAIQLLESLKGEEKVMPFRPVLKTNRQDRIFKDW